MRQYLARNPRNNIGKLYAIRMLFWMHFVSSVLIPFFRQWAGISFLQIFLLNAWFMLWNAVLEVPTGTVADRWSRRLSIALACATGAIAALVYASRPHYACFLLGEVLFACAFTLLSGADEALAYDSLVAAGETTRAPAVFARLESWKLGGIVGGALLGSPMAALWGLRAPLLLETIPLTLAAGIATTLAEPRRQGDRLRRGAFVHLLRDGVQYFLSHATLRILACDLVLTGCLTWMIIWLYQPLLAGVGIDLAYFGVVHAAMSLGQIVVLGQVSRLERWLGNRRRLLRFTAVVPAAAFLILGVSDQAPLVLAGIVLAASFGLARGPLFSSALNRHIPSETRATVLSAISMLRTAAIMVVNPIVGALADWSLRPTMLALGAAAFAVALLSGVREQHLLDSQQGMPDA